MKIPTHLMGGAALSALTLAVSTATAQPVPGGTLDPLSIPKYVTPLVIPQVLFDDNDGTSPLNVSVALRQFQQQVLPNGFPTTTLWGYCDGSQAGTGSCNNPASTFEVTQDTLTTVTWKNELVDAQGNYLPHVIQDANGNPLIDQTLHWAAPNQDCTDGIARTDCAGASAASYTGPIPMVTHLHGAHVGPISDGFPEAWWLPAANDIPAGYATEGTFYDDINGGAPGTGSAVYQYDNSQPTSTLWYHDHSLGVTRLNVYAAGAGFWLIRDKEDGESGLVEGVLPGPAPSLGDNPNCVGDDDDRDGIAGLSKHSDSGDDKCNRYKIREIPLAIQPKSFNLDGSQYYPADRAFFEGLGVGDLFADNTDLNIPFLPQATSDIAPVWNPEAFFNTMVVNGNTWPVLDVAPERYRFRLLNASDSRFLNLSLVAIDQRVRRNGTIRERVLGEVPIYQIGSEQGLLPNVVRIETGFATPLPGDGSDVNPRFPTCERRNGRLVRNCVVAEPGTFAEQALLLGPAERADVIVDFSALPRRTDVVRLINTAPDAPFGGFPDVPADTATTGQVMQFVINNDLEYDDDDDDRRKGHDNRDPSTPAPELVLDPNPGGVPKLGPSTNTQDLALLEEESALLCVTIDAVTGVIDLDPDSVPPTCDPVLGSVPFAPMAAVLGVNGSGGGTAQLWDDPISTNPALDATETWELWNRSADAHPIHLHLVKFEVVNREVIGGAVRSPEPWELGWKDTVIAYPGEITRVKALFDKGGLYVWHCHILSHEDNEMMVPYCVDDPVADPGSPTGFACGDVGGWPVDVVSAP